MDKIKNRQKKQFDFSQYETKSDKQLIEIGEEWVNSNNINDLQRCFDYIVALRDKQKFTVASTLSGYLFEKVPSARHLNAWMISISDEGDISKQVALLEQMEDKLSLCNITYERNVFCTWLKSLNFLIDIGKADRQTFFNVFDRCPEEEKQTNTYLIAQYYVRLNADGKFNEVIDHYENTVTDGAKINTYVKRYYERAKQLGGRLTPIIPQQSQGNDKGIFIIFGRNQKQYSIIKKVLETSDAYIVSLKETGTEGSKTIIEQIESHINEARYAIVLLSADDIGYLASDIPAIGPNRVRENVLFEYGCVVGAMGRDKVVSISSDDTIELPTDVIGVRFISLNLDAPKNGISDLVNQLKRWGFTLNSSKLVELLLET